VYGGAWGYQLASPPSPVVDIQGPPAKRPSTGTRSLYRREEGKKPAKEDVPANALEHAFAGMCSKKASPQRRQGKRFSPANWRKPTPGLEPGTPSLRGKDKWGTRVNARARAGTFSLETERFHNSGSGRACPLVPELTYPFRTRAADPRRAGRRSWARTGCQAGVKLLGRGKPMSLREPHGPFRCLGSWVPAGATH
jgi:hypothetical protein